MVAELGERVEVGIHTHNDAECGVANSLAAVEAGARMVQGTINGYGERCGNANLVSILPALQLKLGYECVPAERLRLLTETAHFVDELTNTTPDPDQPYVGRNAFAHKGGMHVAGVQADARTFEHMDPKLVGNSRDVLISELSGKGSVLSRAEGAGIELDADAAKRAVERIKEREHRGYHYEAADASFDLLLRREAGEYQPLFRLESFRVITEKRADGQVETEATIKIWVEGRALRAHRRGQRPGERARPGAARRDRRAAPAPRRDRAGRLQGPHPRLPPRHRRRHAGAARRLRRPASRGARSASRRTSSRPPGRRWSTRSSTRSSRSKRRVDSSLSRIPLARPELGEREEELVLEVLRSGRLSLGPMQERFERGLRRLARRARRGRGLLGHGGASPRRARARLGRGRRGRDDAVQLRRLGELPALRGRDAGLLRRRPGDAEPRPRRRREAIGERTAGLLPVDILGYPAAMPALEKIAAERRPRPARGRLRGARRASTPRAARSARAATSPPSPSTPTSS